MKLRYGVTRIVIIVFGLAFKFPNIRSWRRFLLGLLGNMQETRFSSILDEDRVCKVVFSIPLGFMNIMRYARPLTNEEFTSLDYTAFNNRKDYDIPVENKISSFGMYKNEIVAVDYGS